MLDRTIAAARSTHRGLMPVTAACLCLGGCAGHNRLPMPFNEASPKLAAKYSEGGVDANGLYSIVPTSLLSNYRAALADSSKAEEARSYRNEVISDFIVLGKSYHAVLDERLRRGRGGLNASLDVAGITTAALATIFTDPVTKTALAGISTVAQGTQDTISKNLFFDQTTEAVIIKMKQLRAEKEITLRNGMNKPVSEYPLELAMVDCADFVLAGGITEGLAALTAEAEEERKKVEDRLDELKRTGVLPLKFNDSPDAVSLRQQLQQAFEADPTKRTTLQSWLNDRGIDTRASVWMFSATADDLKAALEVVQGSGS